MTTGERKVAVISGGTGYVGSHIAKQLSADGISIALLYNRASKEKIVQVLSTLEGKGHKAYFCDLSDFSSVEKVLDCIEVEIGKIYFCIHAAGTMPLRKQLHSISVDDMRKQFETDVFGSFVFLKECSKRLKEYGRGVIIAITTAGVATSVNTKARGVYSVVKFALQGMLVSLKEELSSFGVRVYSLAPGVLPGGMNEDTPQAFLDMVKEKSPTKKLAGAEDVAEKVSFLCSEGSRHMEDLTVVIAPESSLM